jgi:hypothetical protein
MSRCMHVGMGYRRRKEIGLKNVWRIIQHLYRTLDFGLKSTLSCMGFVGVY